MQNTNPKPILNTSLPAQFRKIRIELAREPGHPEGDSADDRIESVLWRQHREACRIARLRPHQQDDHGHLVHRQGDSWAFHYDAGANTPDEVGFHFADQRFVTSEYVTINEGGKPHTYRVVTVNRL
jgi:hypothetical protein